MSAPRLASLRPKATEVARSELAALPVRPAQYRKQAVCSPVSMQHAALQHTHVVCNPITDAHSSNIPRVARPTSESDTVAKVTPMQSKATAASSILVGTFLNQTASMRMMAGAMRILDSW